MVHWIIILGITTVTFMVLFIVTYVKLRKLKRKVLKALLQSKGS